MFASIVCHQGVSHPRWAQLHREIPRKTLLPFDLLPTRLRAQPSSFANGGEGEEVRREHNPYPASQASVEACGTAAALDWEVPHAIRAGPAAAVMAGASPVNEPAIRILVP